MLNLNEHLIEASIRQGRVHLQLGELYPGESVELEMPRGSLWLLEPGAYDIEAGSGDQPTRIRVFEGKARFVGGQSDHPIAAGEEAEVTGAYPAIVTARRLVSPRVPAPGSEANPSQSKAPPTLSSPAPEDRPTTAASEPAGAARSYGPPDQQCRDRVQPSRARRRNPAAGRLELASSGSPLILIRRLSPLDCRIRVRCGAGAAGSKDPDSDTAVCTAPADQRRGARRLRQLAQPR